MTSDTPKFNLISRPEVSDHFYNHGLGDYNFFFCIWVNNYLLPILGLREEEYETHDNVQGSLKFKGRFANFTTEPDDNMVALELPFPQPEVIRDIVDQLSTGRWSMQNSVDLNERKITFYTSDKNLAIYLKLNY